MSRFTAAWLALRERYDMAARSREILDAATASLKSLPSVHLVDLASGSGSTVRAVHSHLPIRQTWDLVDNDPDLLAVATHGNPDQDIALNTVVLDLNRNFEAAFQSTIDLITISALLDLVSEAWLERFSRNIAALALPVYAALTYDGRTQLSPDDPLDAAIVSAVNAHQRTDKGFGPALGPSAAGSAIARFKSLSYSVISAESDWVIGPDDRAMQTELLVGWAAAAREMGTLPDAEVASWLERRKAAISQGVSSIRVGHVDFFASPSSTR